MIKQISSQAKTVLPQLEAQSLNALVGGFAFASAIAWMDVARFVIAQVVNVPKNGGMYYTLTALLTTLLSIVVYMLLRRVSKKVQEPAQPVYAVSN
jgi:membrane protein implicated in regulation of membrane protease activity